MRQCGRDFARVRTKAAMRRDAGRDEWSGRSRRWSTTRFARRRRRRPQLSVDHRLGRERRDAPLHPERPPDAKRRSPADRRRMRVDFYASDVTRTFPVGTRFSPAQRALYAVVLEAQRGDRIDKTRRAFRRRARSRSARAGRGHDQSRPRQGTARRHATAAYSPLLYASHQPLARDGRA